MRFGNAVVEGRVVPVVLDVGRGWVPLAQMSDRLPEDVRPDLAGLVAAGLGTELRDRIGEAAATVPTRHVIDPDATLAAPFRRPRMLWGIGLNYVDHARDLEAPHPTEPASFIKGDHTIVGPGDAIVIPPESQRVTAEAELGLVIGTEAWRIDESDALDHVAAVMCVLDQTAEDILQRNPRFLTRAKNFPTFLSLGGELVTTDEVRSPTTGFNHLTVATWLNGALHRENTVGNMAFDPSALVAFHSHVFPLQPGDIILTGTPGAVVVAHGDVVECRIDGIGSLVNTVCAEA